MTTHGSPYFELSARASNIIRAIYHNSISYVEIDHVARLSEQDLACWGGCGPKTLKEVRDELARHGRKFAEHDAIDLNYPRYVSMGFPDGHVVLGFDVPVHICAYCSP